MKKIVLLLFVAIIALSCTHKIEIATKENTPISIMEAVPDTVLLVVTPGNDDERDFYIMDKQKNPVYKIENGLEEDKSPLGLFVLGLMIGAFIMLILIVIGD